MLAACLVVLSVVLQATSAQEMTSTHINKRTKVVQVHIDASHMQGESTAALTLPLRADDFMKKYATEEFSVSSEELRLAKVLPLSNTGNAAYKYQQYAGGLRIVGAELIIVENQKHGVLQAKSHSLMTNAADLAASALRISIAPVEAVTLLQQYMTSKYGSKKQFNMDISSKEMVFYQGHEGKELETPVEAYELKGSSVLDIGESNYGVVYTAYIDTKTGAVIDYTARGEPSEEDQKVKKVETAKANTKESRSLRGRETSKTILETTGGFVNFDDFGTASEFIVYDCLGQASCPSNPAIMWRSSTGTWPTNDEEINKAVAVSAQLVRMMRAISNQEWVTFGITARQQKIYLHIDMVNAYYNGNGIYFGQELVVDDVIAHEWAHGYCDYSSNLRYYSQSGALNEANSDIVGETIDILNSQEVGTSIGESDMIRMDSPRRMVQECNIDNWQYQDETGNDPSRWWIVGEDVDRNTLGAIRDMYKPECFGHPGSMDSDDFYCGSGDNMGVHLNSGVGNRLFALMVQGGKTLGGVDLPALGFTKALSLMWNTQNAIGENTNFQEYQLELKSQCSFAIGTTFLVPDWKTGASTPATTTDGLLTQTDCDNLDAIIEEGKLAYEVDYSSCTIIQPGPPTAVPTGPTFSPTIPPPIPDTFPAYTASGGNTVDETVYVCAGDSIEFSMCPGVGQCTADTKLTLYDSNNREVATNDDSCGFCSSLQFDFVEACQTYTVKQGCWSTSSCGGQVKLLLSGSPEPTTTPQEASPTARPTTRPTVRPTTGTPTITPTRTPTRTPTMTPTTKTPTSTYCSDITGWSKRKTYKTKDVVRIGNRVFKATNKKKNKGKDPTRSKFKSYWREVEGGCTYKCLEVGAWKKTAKYKKGSMVRVGTVLYKSKKPSKNRDPNQSKNKGFWITIGECVFDPSAAPTEAPTYLFPPTLSPTEETTTTDCFDAAEWKKSKTYKNKNIVRVNTNTYQATNAKKNKGKDPTLNKNKAFWTSTGPCAFLCEGVGAWNRKKKYKKGLMARVGTVLYQSKKPSKNRDPNQSKNKGFWITIGGCVMTGTR